MSYNKKQQTFLHGSLILVIATALVKVIGAIYRIPLANMLGTTGMGYYSTAYDVYVPMYSIAMAGLPIAISRLVAEHVAAGRYRDVRKTLNVARVAFVITGGAGFVLMIIAAFVLTGTGIFNKGSLPGILCIAPCLIFCCIMSVYRGYFEGLRNMTPTAVSEVLDALGKLLFGFTIAWAVLKTTGNYSYATAGALAGITISSAFSSLYLIIKYRKHGAKHFSEIQLLEAPAPAASRIAMRTLILIAIPIVLGSLVNNVTSLIDVVMVQSRLSAALQKSPEYFKQLYSSLIVENIKDDASFNWIKDLPNALYGCHRGYAFSIYNLVPVLTSTLGVSAIPVLATAWTKRDMKEVKSNVDTMLRTTALIAMPAGCGIIALSGPILDMLYSDAAAVAVATPNLRILGLCAIFAGLNAPMVNMLQAIGRQVVPLRNIAVGAVLKIIINFILVGTPEINIVGVPIGTTVCYAYICIANLVSFARCSKITPDIPGAVIKPMFAAGFCGVSAFISYSLISKFIISNLINTAFSIIIAAIVYVLLVAIFKIIQYNDIVSLPKGEKIAKTLAKLHIIR